MKKFFIAFIVCFIVVFIVSMAVLKVIVKDSVVRHLEQVWPGDVQVEQVDLSFASGRVTFHNVNLTSPHGFFQRIYVEKFSVAVSLMALLKKEIVIQDFVLGSGRIELQKPEILPLVLGSFLGANTGKESVGAVDDASLESSGEDKPAALGQDVLIKKLSLHSMTLGYQNYTYLSLDHLELDHIRWGGAYQRPGDIELKATLFEQQDAPLLIKAQLIVSNRQIKLLNLDQTWSGFNLESINRALPQDVRLAGTVDMRVEYNSPNPLQYHLGLSKGGFSWSGLGDNQAYVDEFFKENALFDMSVAVADPNGEPLISHSFRNLSLKGIKIPALTMQYRLPRSGQPFWISSLTLDGVNYIWDRQAGRGAMLEGVSSAFKAQVAAEARRKLRGSLEANPVVQTEKVAASSSAAYPVVVESLELLNGRLEVRDLAADNRPVSLKLTPISLKAKQIRLMEQTPVSFSGSAGVEGSRATIALDGEISPLLKPLNFNLNLSLKNLPIGLLEPYFADRIKRKIMSGFVGLEMGGNCENDYLYLRQRIFLEDLSFEEPQEGYEGDIMGLNAEDVLMYLENKSGQIEVPFKIEGDLKNPKSFLNWKDLVFDAILKEILSSEHFVRNVGNQLLSRLVSKSSGEPSAENASSEEPVSDKERLKNTGKRLENQFKQLLGI